MELQLEDANCLFRTLLTDSTQQLKALSQKVGKKMTLKYVEEVYMIYVSRIFLVGHLKMTKTSKLNDVLMSSSDANTNPDFFHIN